MRTKIIALYLPQFHCIPENDEFWGKGFTDWVTVRKAKPLFEGHLQPRVPLNNNYYDLSLKENVEWQSDLAYKYNIYGFGVYHYWFNNEKNLLTKPAEIMRDDENIKTNYFFIWDNSNWKRSWSNVPGNAWAPAVDGENKQGPQILIPYILGEEKDWENHYRYVSTHFKSKRYIKIDNKPVFGIFGYSKEIMRMCDYWEKLAKSEGYEGVHFVFHNPRTNILPDNVFRYNYEPHSSGWQTPLSYFDRILLRLHLKNLDFQGVLFYDYDELWKNLIKHAKDHSEKRLYHGAFVSYDDSPRRGEKKSIIVKGATPNKFEHYLSELIKISEAQHKDFIFLTAWNEWGEGAFLEPDETHRLDYLQAISNAIKHLS